MASGLVVHISNGHERHTEVLSVERVLIGPGENCHIRLGSDLLTDSSIFIELARHNGHFLVSEFDPELGITLNGKPLSRGAGIDDGDELRFGPFNVGMQFFLVNDLPAIVPGRRASVAPFIETAAMEAAATSRRDDAKVFLREFTRELLREISPTTKLVTFLIALSLVGGILYLAHAAYSELRDGREAMTRQNQQLSQLQSEIDRTNQQLEETNRSNLEIRDSMSLAPRLRSQYGNGVALVAGSYMLYDPATNRPFRYPSNAPGDEGSALPGGPPPPILTTEGRGAPYIADFVGTGFHIGNGFIVTNRHLLAEPWEADDNILALGASVGGKFRVTRIVVFFPGHRQPFVLRPRESSSRDDIAVGQVDPKELPSDIPTLPLDKNSEAFGIGKDVVMMGYPSGQERLIATLPENELQGIRQLYGASIETLLTYLAERNFIKPLTSRGHITDLEGRGIVFNASNAVGGSGSPVFGVSGRVIGINFASFTEIPDQNYAVPVRLLYPVLARTGWKSPAPDDAETAETNAVKPNEPRPNAPPTQNR